MGPNRVRAHRERVELELARDLAALIQAGLIQRVGPASGASDETLRFGLSEIDDPTAGGFVMAPPADEDPEAAG